MTRTDNNPLLTPFELPAFAEIEASHVVPAMTHLLDELEGAFKGLEGTASADYDELIRPLEVIHTRLDYTWNIVNHLKGVRNSSELREAHAEIQPRVVEFRTAMGQSRVVYDAVLELHKSKGDGLSPAQRRIVESMVLNARNSGVGLDGDSRARFNAIQGRLAELGTAFSNNLLDSIAAWSRLVTDRKETEGLPETARMLFAQAAVDAGHEGATADEGPWLITLTVPSVFPVLQHGEHRPLREEVYRAFISRASSEPNDNAPLLEEILALRAEQAGLLGYANYVEKSLSTKMASDLADVMDLLESVRDAALPAAKRELDELRAFAAKLGLKSDLQHWDVRFYSERMREAEFDFKSEDVKPYLPIDHVLDGLFEIISVAFGATFREVKGEFSAWHDDVRLFELLNGDGDRVARVFCDFFSRPGLKRSGAWMSECLPRYHDPDSDTAVTPVAYVVGNFTPAVGGRPALLSFNEARTIFHEFGHALQHMLTNVEEVFAAGIANVEWDAVEVPSTFMEEWLYVPTVIKSIALHYETNEPIPDALVEKLIAVRKFRAGSFLVRQLDFGMTDMALHQSGASDRVDAFKVQREVRARTTAMPPLEEDRFLCAFAHIFAGGYAAGYYSYMWAAVMSADAFGRFREAGVDDRANWAEPGAAFRDTFLGLGGAVHPAEVFKTFRGRGPDPRPMLDRLGL